MTDLSRRHLLGVAGVAGLAPALAGAPAVAAPAASPYARTDLNPDQALALLKEGNRRFISDRPTRAPLDRARRLAIAKSQTPFAVLVSCSDSRVGPEQLFGRGLGELFIVRNAGNTAASTQSIGSIEFAVGVLGVPLVVVLGHERCGAVVAAVDVVQKNALFPGSIGRMVEPIVPAALEVRGVAGDMVENACRANIRRTVTQLRTSVEPIMLEPQKQGKLKVVGAYYDLDTGAVEFFDD